MIKLPRNSDLAIKVLEFEREKMKLSYDLTSQGLRSGSVAVCLVFVGVMAMLLVAYLTSPKDAALFTGIHIVMAVVVLTVGVVAYFAFVFKREARLMTKLTDQFEIGFSSSKETSDF